MIKFLKRMISPKPNWFEAMDTRPTSTVFGMDRGTPVDRFYIENFLNDHRNLIQGKVLEIAESSYSKKFATQVQSFEVLHVDSSNPNATIIGDLSNPDTLPENAVDSFICTQTLNFIYDVKAAVQGIHKILKPNGTVLVTVACLTQISRYDMDRWGDYWRFTPLSIQKLFEEVFGTCKVEVHGNVYAATALLNGLAVEELKQDKLQVSDPDYPVIITIIAKKEAH